MTRSTVSVIIPAFLVFVLAAGQVQADQGQKGKPGGPAGKGQGLREEALKRFDKDGDGKLNEQERGTARQALQAKGLPGKGAPGIGGAGKGNGPGNGPGREAILQRFDKNGDGKLNDEERAAARKAMEERQKNKYTSLGGN